MTLLQDGILAFFSAVGMTTVVWLAAGAGLAACMLSLCRELLPNRNKKTR